jgi:hypothetical protein
VRGAPWQWDTYREIVRALPGVVRVSCPEDWLDPVFQHDAAFRIHITATSSPTAPPRPEALSACREMKTGRDLASQATHPFKQF